MKQPFLSWCLAQNVGFPNLQLGGLSTQYRYMTYDNPDFTLTSSLTIDGNILQVPLSACIIADTPEKLAHKLAKERDLGYDSNYAPYIDVLPPLQSKDGKYVGPLSSMPRFWDSEMIEFVSAADGGQMERKLNEDERKDLDPWAWACVSSRANYVLGHGFAMTPILDMINHDSSVSTSAKIINDNELHLSIDDKFSIGDEVFISYGDLTNLETLCNYGFVSTKENKCNFESIDIFMMRKPPCKVTISGKDGSIDQGSLATLRSYLATPAELENASNSFFATPISDSNEEEVCCLIASYLDEAMTDATEGADKIQGENDLIETYLRKRAETLEKGLQKIKKRFPLLEY